jgi:hypothetical protein
MSRFLISASVVAIVIGSSMPMASAQWGDDEGYRPRRHYDDGDYYRPPVRRPRYDDEGEYYRPTRRPHYEDEDYHRHAPVIIIHPPSWLGGGERPSYNEGGSRRPGGGTDAQDNRPNWEKNADKEKQQKQDWDKSGGYGGRQ